MFSAAVAPVPCLVSILFPAVTPSVRSANEVESHSLLVIGTPSQDTPDAITTRPRSKTTSTRRPAERQHTLSHRTLWFGVSRLVSQLGPPHNDPNFPCLDPSSHWRRRPAARYLIYLSGRPDWSTHSQTQPAPSCQSRIRFWFPGLRGWDSPPARPTTEKLDGPV